MTVRVLVLLGIIYRHIGYYGLLGGRAGHAASGRVFRCSECGLAAGESGAEAMIYLKYLRDKLDVDI